VAEVSGGHLADFGFEALVEGEELVAGALHGVEGGVDGVAGAVVGVPDVFVVVGVGVLDDV